MSMVVLDPTDQDRILAQRRESGGDRHDEVWDGVYIMSPLANNEHQTLVLRLSIIFDQVVREPGLGFVQPGANVSDRADNWEHNFRCPDVVVFLDDNPAVDHDTHWQGGPDFAVEIVSRHDRSREKFDFYAAVGLRELLIVDRYPWSLELHRLNGSSTYNLVGRLEPDQPATLPSGVMPLTFGLEAGIQKPRVAAAHVQDGRTWTT